MTYRFLFSLISFLSALCLTIPNTSWAKENCAKAAKLTEDSQQLLDSNPAKAEEKLREAVDLCPRSAAVHYNYGVALHELGRNSEAVIRFEEALKLKPEYAKAMNSLAAVLYATKRNTHYDRAYKLAKKAVDLDPRNRQFKETLDSIGAFVDIPPSTTANNPDAVAVVIGNKHYKNSQIPSVEYADHDAETLKKYLVDALGYNEGNIMILHDANYMDIRKLFGSEADHRGTLYNRTRTGRSDLFIFYAGHGAPDTNTKKAYIAPADVDPYSINQTAYSLDLLYENLSKLTEEKRPKSLTLVLDACFSGASEGGTVIKGASPIVIEVTTPILKLKDAAVFTSSAGNQISSWYPDQKHGLFTYFFLKAIRDRVSEGKPLTSGDLEQSLLGSDSVTDFAWRLHNREQTPQVVGNKGIVLAPEIK